MCEDLGDSKAFILDGADGECQPALISVLLFVDGADGEWGGVSPAQVVTYDQNVSSKIAPDLAN